MSDRDLLDQEANAFAMELLMPEEWVRKDIEEAGGCDLDDESMVRTLARRYKVSYNVMLLRLGMIFDGDNNSLAEGDK